MSMPVYQIETYTGAALDHTINTDATKIRCKEVLTDAVGTFSFLLSYGAEVSYKYNDIALFDKVKIFLGYDSVPGTATFIGRITNISAPFETGTGYVREIAGLSQGEILLRRQKTNEKWISTEVDDIVAQVASDLSLGAGSIEVDVSSITYTSDGKTYFDLLRDISDFWVNAGTQVKKDFYVDINNNLVWCSRDGTSPFRSGASVETLTVGSNIVNYTVLRDLNPVKNNITVYGVAGQPVPSDKDSWTEDTTDWSASVGTLDAPGGVTKLGAAAVRCTAAVDSDTITFKRVFDRLTTKTINTLYFWTWLSTTANTYKVRLLCPDTSNYVETDTSGAMAWTFHELALGPNQEYDAEENPNGVWTVAAGTPNWWDIEGIQWNYVFIANNNYTMIDALYFYPERFSDTTSDAGSIASYGQRDIEVIDDQLQSNTECESRSEALLYQLKDPPTQIDVTVIGNTNILVGDRLSMTIPAEAISAANYDVVAVQHSLSERGFFTTASLMSSANTRQLIESSPATMLSNVRRDVRQLAMDRRIVR